MVERRAYKRFPISLRGICRICDGDPTSFRISIENISAKGVCFTSSVKVEDGQEIELELEWGESRLTKIKVEIIWAKMLTDCKQWIVGSKIIDTPLKNYEEFVRLYLKEVLNLPEEKKI